MSRATPPPASPWLAVATALLVDLADLLTFGPVGLWTGMLLGLVLGWSLAPQLGFAQRRWLPAIAAGAYCMLPGTALMPLATLATALRSWSTAQAPPGAQEPRATPAREREKAIEAEFESRWDDGPPPARD